MTDGTLETIDGRPALRFERTLAHSVERVWRAVSEPAELERWFPAAADWTPATGETFEAYGATGEVTEVDAPHRLAWTFGGDRYRFELPQRKKAAGWPSSTSSTTVRSRRRPPPDGRPTSRGSSRTSPAASCPRRRRTSRGRRFTSATPNASGSTRRRAGASSPALHPSLTIESPAGEVRAWTPREVSDGGRLGAARPSGTAPRSRTLMPCDRLHERTGHTDRRRTPGRRQSAGRLDAEECLAVRSRVGEVRGDPRRVDHEAAQLPAIVGERAYNGSQLSGVASSPRSVPSIATSRATNSSRSSNLCSLQHAL